MEPAADRREDYSTLAAARRRKSLRNVARPLTGRSTGRSSCPDQRGSTAAMGPPVTGGNTPTSRTKKWAKSPPQWKPAGHRAETWELDVVPTADGSQSQWSPPIKAGTPVGPRNIGRPWVTLQWSPPMTSGNISVRPARENALTWPQWSPPLNSRNTGVTHSAQFAPAVPQWSPPVTDGNVGATPGLVLKYSQLQWSPQLTDGNTSRCRCRWSARRRCRNGARRRPAGHQIRAMPIETYAWWPQWSPPVTGGSSR